MVVEDIGSSLVVEDIGGRLVLVGALSPNKASSLRVGVGGYVC